MAKYPSNLCPLCGSGLIISGDRVIGMGFLETKVECDNTECPYYKVYMLRVDDIVNHGIPQN